MDARVLGLPLFVISLFLVDIPLKVSYFIWRLGDVTAPLAARLGCLGCLIGLPLFAIYFTNTIVTLPLFVLMLVIGWLDLKLGITNAGRLTIAQQSFFWPHIILYLLMPRLYGVEIVGPVGLVYALRDIETEETALVMPGPRVVKPTGSTEGRE